MAPFAAVGCAYLLARMLVLEGAGASEGHGIQTLLFTMPGLIWFYARLVIWPFGLSPFYDTPLLNGPETAGFLLPLAGLVLLAGLAAWRVSASRQEALGLAFTAAFLLPPLIGVYSFPADALVHDRYLYLPSAGIALWLFAVIGKSRPRLALGLALMLVSAGATAAQSRWWANDSTLYTRAVSRAPENALALNLLANELYKRKQPEEALELYRRALRLRPGNWATYFSLGVTEFETGDYAGARAHLRQATAIANGNPDQYYVLGLANLRLGNWEEAEEAMRALLARDPARAGVRVLLATALQKQGRVREAVRELESELQHHSDSPARALLEHWQRDAEDDLP
jgi:tetratricopeptide (TPR) repeat protein